jgi:hypothetical protein
MFKKNPAFKYFCFSTVETFSPDQYFIMPLLIPSFGTCVTKLIRFWKWAKSVMPVAPKYMANSLFVAIEHIDFMIIDENDHVDFFKKSIINY